MFFFLKQFSIKEFILNVEKLTGSSRENAYKILIQAKTLFTISRNEVFSKSFCINSCDIVLFFS